MDVSQPDRAELPVAITYSVTPTADEEALLTWIVVGYNKAHDLNLSNQDFIGLRFVQLLEPYQKPFQEATLTALTSDFLKASSEVQGQIRNLLNIKLP